MAPQIFDYYHIERHRLETFKNPPKALYSTVSSLCRNGFIATGMRYICVFCYKQITQVDVNDDIPKKHHKISKNCRIYMNGYNFPLNIQKFNADKEHYLTMNRVERQRQEMARKVRRNNQNTIRLKLQ